MISPVYYPTQFPDQAAEVVQWCQHHIPNVPSTGSIDPPNQLDSIHLENSQSQSLDEEGEALARHDVSSSAYFIIPSLIDCVSIHT